MVVCLYTKLARLAAYCGTFFFPEFRGAACQFITQSAFVWTHPAHSNLIKFAALRSKFNVVRTFSFACCSSWACFAEININTSFMNQKTAPRLSCTHASQDSLCWLYVVPFAVRIQTRYCTRKESRDARIFFFLQWRLIQGLQRDAKCPPFLNWPGDLKIWGRSKPNWSLRNRNILLHRVALCHWFTWVSWAMGFSNSTAFNSTERALVAALTTVQPAQAMV